MLLVYDNGVTHIAENKNLSFISKSNLKSAYYMNDDLRVILIWGDGELVEYVIKFRVYVTDRESMHYTDENLVVCFSDNGVDVIDRTTFSSSCMDIENYVLMQSAGLKDKYGV